MRSLQAFSLIKKTGFIAVAVVFSVIIGSAPLAQPAIAAACAPPLGSSQTSRESVVKAAYQDWKAKYVTSDGAAGDLRVQRSDFDGYDTVSEGIAYGMLFAVYNNDKTTFDGLWAYAQKHVNGNGVMNWRIAANGSTAGYNGATDADEDMAAALVAADTTWGGYRSAAVRQIEVVKRYQIEAGTGIVKPGDVWGGSDLLNPSYIAPAYYDVFQSYTGDTSWATVKAAGYKVLQAGQNSTTGLLPDWSAANGNAVGGMSYNYGYDASRAPLRLAMSAAWSCDSSAISTLAPLNSWFEKQNLNQLASSYSLTGTALDKGDGTPLLAAATSAAITSQNNTYRSSSWNALVSAKGSSYYPESMRLFGLLVASGLMTSPIAIPAQQPTTTTPRAYEISGADTTITSGTATSVALSFVAPTQRDTVLIDLELYDSNNRKVAQQVYENQTLTSTAKSYELQWANPSTGTYTLKAGIFKAGWSENLKWNDKVATVTVNTVPVVTTPAPAPVTPAPTPEPTPVVVLPTPTPTPVVVPPAPTPTTPVAVQPSTPAEPVIIQPTAPVVQPATPVAAQPAVPVQPAQPINLTVSIWWPGSTQPVSGVQPFKAVIDGLDVGNYEMYWQVGEGQLNRMESIRDGAPHKLYMVDLQNWTWSSNGKYTINFVAKNTDGTIMAQKSTIITVVR